VIQLAVAAYAAWVLERTKETLKEAGAVSEETAKTPEELNLDEKWLKMSANTIIPSGVVATKDGRYYLKTQ
jgi:nicotinamide mononucleotide (NMN) deamidase PncC